jgi:hypothetical protein
VIVSTISPGNKALEFIDTRIKNEKYRGYHSSQHNRYTMEQIIDIITLLNRYAPYKKLMTIRTTDISKSSSGKARNSSNIIAISGLSRK